MSDYDIFLIVIPIYFITSSAGIQLMHFCIIVSAMQKPQVFPQSTAHLAIVSPHFAHSAGVQPSTL